MTFNAGIEAAAKDLHEIRELEEAYGVEFLKRSLHEAGIRWRELTAPNRNNTRPSSSAPVEQREAVAREPFGYIYSFDGCMESTFSTERKSEYMRDEPWTETAVYTRPSQSDMEAACDALGEGIEILINLTNSIKEHGNYSEASTVNFIDQALQCFREAILSLPGSSRDEAYAQGVADADQLIGCLWVDLFNKDLVKASGADYFDKWRDRIRALKSGGAK